MQNESNFYIYGRNAVLETLKSGQDVEKVYYTINETQYGVWNVNKDSDRSFNMR